MDLVYNKSGQGLLEQNFIKRNLCGINVVGGIIESVSLWNWVRVHLIG